MDRLHAFVRYHNRRFLFLNGQFGENSSGAQCVNVANEWAHKLHLPGFEGNAVDFLDQERAGWRLVMNEPANIPVRGSLVMFEGQETAGPAGHVDVFLWGDALSFEGFDQNWPEGAPCLRVKHDYNSVVAWFEPEVSLRPRGGRLARHESWTVRDLARLKSDQFIWRPHP